jgi:hypothetical protein
MKNDFIYLLTVTPADNSVPAQNVMAFSTREGAEDCKAEYELMDGIIGFNNIWKIEEISYESETVVSDESDLELAKTFAKLLKGCIS